MNPSSNRRPRGFEHVETWIFDLDNTLYPHNVNLWQQVDERIRDYIADFLKVTHKEAFRLQKDYYKRYGTSMRGMITEHGMRSDDFLDFVHQIDHSPLEPNPALGDAIEKLPGRKVILTNGTRPTPTRARAARDRAALPGRVRYHRSGARAKAVAETYDRFLEALKIGAATAAMFEDLARNLAVPHALGMTTVLVVPEHSRKCSARSGSSKAAMRLMSITSRTISPPF